MFSCGRWAFIIIIISSCENLIVVCLTVRKRHVTCKEQQGKIENVERQKGNYGNRSTCIGNNPIFFEFFLANCHQPTAQSAPNPSQKCECQLLAIGDTTEFQCILIISVRSTTGNAAACEPGNHSDHSTQGTSPRCVPTPPALGAAPNLFAQARSSQARPLCPNARTILCHSMTLLTNPNKKRTRNGFQMVFHYCWGKM